MAKIITKANLAPAVYEFVVDAPLVAHKMPSRTVCNHPH